MKKFIIALCALLALTFVFVGCKDKNKDNNQEPSQQTPSYTIQWFDESGNLITTTQVKKGDEPAYQYNLVDTAEWDYTFLGWANSVNGEVLERLPSVDKDCSYYACASKAKQKYTVTFNTLGGSSVAEQVVEYGSKAVEPQAPTRRGYRFMGWSLTANTYTAVDFEQPITESVIYYAVWNELVDVVGLLDSLLNGYEFNPINYIPESMMYNYAPNLINSDDIIDNYGSFINVSDISYGFGEQWHMVLDNLLQSQSFYNVLTVVEGLTSVSISAFNNYFDNNPADTASYQFKHGIYNVTIKYDGEIIVYLLDYTATLPLLGEQSIQIALMMDVETSQRIVRIQLGEANALTYTILEDSYEFAIKYLGARTAMFSIKRANDGSVTGKIYEYLTVAGVQSSSRAEFYITDSYVSVVGNKASGMIGFTGCINELYNAENGTMIGYEVKESLSSIVYNTLWFNLKDISGINTIKYIPATQEDTAKLYVNGSTSVWKNKKVGGLGVKMLSRRFDIEFRTQYVYAYDAQNEAYVEYRVEVPMLFVQEEVYDTLVSDVKEVNQVTISVLIDKDDVEKILNDYDTLIPIFEKDKDIFTVEVITAFIGDKIVLQ